MKKIILTITICFVLNTNAQTSASITTGICFGDSNQGGANFSVDFLTKYGNNIVGPSFTLGNEIHFAFLEKQRERTFYNIDLLYGRKLFNYKSFEIQGLIGIGYLKEEFINKETNWKNVSKSALGIPLKARFLFNKTKNFSFGMCPTIYINDIETIYSLNVVFQAN